MPLAMRGGRGGAWGGGGSGYANYSRLLGIMQMGINTIVSLLNMNLHPGIQQGISNPDRWGGGCFSSCRVMEICHRRLRIHLISGFVVCCLTVHFASGSLSNSQEIS